jgi:hypothetical protein
MPLLSHEISVTPAKAGVQLGRPKKKLDPGLRRDDGKSSWGWVA